MILTPIDPYTLYPVPKKAIVYDKLSNIYRLIPLLTMEW